MLRNQSRRRRGETQEGYGEAWNLLCLGNSVYQPERGQRRKVDVLAELIVGRIAQNSTWTKIKSTKIRECVGKARRTLSILWSGGGTLFLRWFVTQMKVVGWDYKIEWGLTGGLLQFLNNTCWVNITRILQSRRKLCTTPSRGDSRGTVGEIWEGAESGIETRYVGCGNRRREQKKSRYKYCRRRGYCERKISQWLLGNLKRVNYRERAQKCW